jgi:hypothetical protein
MNEHDDTLARFKRRFQAIEAEIPERSFQVARPRSRPRSLVDAPALAVVAVMLLILALVVIPQALRPSTPVAVGGPSSPPSLSADLSPTPGVSEDSTATPPLIGSARPGSLIPLWTSAPPPVINGDEVCRSALGGGRLARHPDSGLGVRNAFGEVQPIVWPFGFEARDDYGVAVLVDADGVVVAREGDFVQFAGGFNVDSVFAACGAVEVIAQTPSPVCSDPCTVKSVRVPANERRHSAARSGLEPRSL